jgi:uncharacterized membrane protein YqhA
VRALYNFVAATRYLVIIPVIGLASTSALLFIVGGYRLLVALYWALTETSYAQNHISIVQILEFVHLFLIGTVLWIMAIGLYQLFISEIPLPKWLQIDDIEELETDLISMTVVVLAVNFLGVIFDSSVNKLEYGVAIALPIAALALYISVREKRSENRQTRTANAPEIHNEDKIKEE